MAEQTFSVSEFIAVFNQTVEHAYPSVVIEGEVASFKVNKDKFIFFDLKDHEGSVGCFMMIFQLRVPLEDGMKVRVIAQPKLTTWGKFSLTVREVSLVGEGSIKRSMQILKEKLDKEGLFDPLHKRALPVMPTKIGLISSTEAAGYADFIKILDQRWGGVDVQVANVNVQGMGADLQIINAINYFNEHAEVEVIVLVRGGGSADDLAVFNSEALVRAIAASRIPTLVGVGHEVDETLADLAADKRAATPSNAAQILVPDRNEILGFAEELFGRIAQNIHTKIAHAEQSTIRLGRELSESLLGIISDIETRLKYQRSLLMQLDPRVVIRRGYALVRDHSGNVVKAQNLQTGDVVSIELSKMDITAEVKDVKTRK